MRKNKNRRNHQQRLLREARKKEKAKDTISTIRSDDCELGLECLFFFKKHSSTIFCVACGRFPDGKPRIISVSSDRYLKIWDKRNKKCEQSLRMNSSVYCVEILEKQNLILCGTGLSEVVFLKIREDNCQVVVSRIIHIREHSVPVNKLFYLERKSFIAIGRTKGTLYLFQNAGSPETPKLIYSTGATVYDLTQMIQEKQCLLVAGYKINNVRITKINWKQSKIVTTFPLLHSERVTCIKTYIDPIEKTENVVTGSWDGYVIITRNDGREILHKIRVKEKLPTYSNSPTYITCSLSLNKDFFLFGVDNGEMWFLDVRQMKMKNLEGELLKKNENIDKRKIHNGWIHCMCKDKDHLFTAGNDGFVGYFNILGLKFTNKFYLMDLKERIEFLCDDEEEQNVFNIQITSLLGSKTIGCYKSLLTWDEQ